MKKKRSEELREAIEERIVVGEFGPGMRLDEAHLAERFGASRTPLREAFIQLASSGLIELRARRGAVVCEPSAQRLIEMFEVMAELEGMCGRLAARRIAPAEMASLEEAHLACAAFSDGATITPTSAFTPPSMRPATTSTWPRRPTACTAGCAPTGACNCACATGWAPRTWSTGRWSPRSGRVTANWQPSVCASMSSCRASVSPTSWPRWPCCARPSAGRRAPSCTLPPAPLAGTATAPSTDRAQGAPGSCRVRA